MANKPKLTPEQVNEIVEQYKAGAKVQDLAAKYGVNRTAISARLMREGVRKARRRPGDYRHQEITIDNDLYDYIKERHPNLSQLVCSFIRHLKNAEEKKRSKPA